MKLKELAKTLLRRTLRTFGYDIVRIAGSKAGSRSTYISAKDTVASAETQGLSVCDFVENLWGKQGDTQKVIDQIVALGALSSKPECILEIGTGTGRYLEKLTARHSPHRYESYEIDPEWAKWLASTYSVISQPTDGQSLSSTADHSVDFLHAHGVFVYLPFLVSYRYWQEIWRVTKPGAQVAFDIISEACLDAQSVESWLDSEHNYPCFLSEDYVMRTFLSQGFSFRGKFFNRYGEGRSLYLLFEKSKGSLASSRPELEGPQ